MTNLPEYDRGWLSGNNLAKAIIAGEVPEIKSTFVATTGADPGVGDPVGALLGELMAPPFWMEQANPALYERIFGDEDLDRDSEEEAAYWEGVEAGVRAADIESRVGGGEAKR